MEDKIPIVTRPEDNGPTRLFLIINPISGTGSKKGLDTKLKTALESHGFDVTVAFTSCRGDATRLAREAVNANYDGVIACGGDGTINETARAMAGTGVAMGIIPAGSGNGLARHIGIPIDPLMAVDVIAERFIRDCDYGTINGQPFFCTFGVGFDAAVSTRFADSGKRGKMTYFKSAFQEFVSYRPDLYTITADGHEITDEAFVVTVCNASQYGNNAYIAPDASITDGYLDIMIIKKMSRMATFLLGVDLLSGTLSRHRGVEHLKVKEAVIKRNGPGPAHLDGEPVDGGSSFEVKCHPGQLKLFVTEKKRPFRPLLTPVESMVNDIGITLRNLIK